MRSHHDQEEAFQEDPEWHQWQDITQEKGPQPLSFSRWSSSRDLCKEQAKRKKKYLARIERRKSS